MVPPPRSCVATRLEQSSSERQYAHSEASFSWLPVVSRSARGQGWHLRHRGATPRWFAPSSPNATVPICPG
ncbi:hypothetical protein F7O44_03985 [Phytoactinopolyspora sp. XMNu-373]|uniref:Uncharacterized protein n=1 Tax=Phytoactinopolyspora mesophila TaxID=2650750 RepID=A0A7K3LYX2_9ACTN|nr:hypothetical protein [Phytoactinopolyspora mesophila]